MSHSSHREKPEILMTGVCKGHLDTRRCRHLVQVRGDYQIKLIFNSEWNPIFCGWSIFLHFKFRVKSSMYPAKTSPSSHSWSQRFLTFFEVFHCSTFHAAEKLNTLQACKVQVVYQNFHIIGVQGKCFNGANSKSKVSGKLTVCFITMPCGYLISAIYPKHAQPIQH